MTKLTDDQYNFLLRPLDDSRVQTLRGNSHLEAWDIRRNLDRAFGIGGWDLETIALDMVREIEHPGSGAGAKSRWTVVYRAQARLVVRAVDGTEVCHYEDAAAGDSCNQPSLGDAHDMAMKTALSQALKRCAVNLGDQFGLSLYNDGATKPVVIRTLNSPATAASPAVQQIGQHDEPVRPEPTPEDVAPVSAPPAPVAAPEELPAPQTMGDVQRKRMFALFNELGAKDKDIQLKFINWAIHPDAPITSRGDLTGPQCERVIRALNDRRAAQARQPQAVSA